MKYVDGWSDVAHRQRVIRQRHRIVMWIIATWSRPPVQVLRDSKAATKRQGLPGCGCTRRHGHRALGWFCCSAHSCTGSGCTTRGCTPTCSEQEAIIRIAYLLPKVVRKNASVATDCGRSPGKLHRQLQSVVFLVTIPVMHEHPRHARKITVRLLLTLLAAFSPTRFSPLLAPLPFSGNGLPMPSLLRHARSIVASPENVIVEVNSSTAFSQEVLHGS